MKLALNLSTLRGLGSAQVGQQTLNRLSRLDPNLELHAWIPSQWGWTEDALGKSGTVHLCNSGMLQKGITENVQIRRAISAQGIDKLFSMGDTSLIASPVPHLLLVQQAFLAYPPSEWGFSPSPRWRAKLRLMTAYFRLGLPSVTRFTVQTHAMKSRFCNRWGIAEDRVIVIPSAVDVAVGLKPSNEDVPYLCYVAGSTPNKNHEVLAPMLSELARRGHRVRCRVTARKESLPGLVKEADGLGVLDLIDFIGPVSKDSAHRLMAGAKVLVMPSKLESFGLSYYEGMALGCPVVAADRDFAREALADAGLFADADSGPAFAQHIDNLLRDPELSGKHQRLGFDRISQIGIGWDDVASQYLEILRDL